MESNIWKYTLHLIANKRTYMSIFGVYLLTIPDTTPQTLGTLMLFGNILGFIFEVPSGYVSDKMGHRKSMILGKALLFCSTLCYFLGYSVEWFFLGAAFSSIGYAFVSGTGQAFMHETLLALGRDKEYSKIMGKANSIGFAVPIVFIVLVPFLTDISYKVAFSVPLILDLVGFIAVSLFVEPPKVQVEIEEISNKNFKDVMNEAISLHLLPYLLFLGSMSALVSATSGFKDIYQQLLGIPVVYYGIFWGMSRIIVSLVLLINHKVTERVSFHQFLLFQYIGYILIVLALGLVGDPAVVVALFILTAAYNWCFKSARHHYLFEIMGKSSFKATLLSMMNLVRLIVMGVAFYLIGTLAADSDFAFAFQMTALGAALLLGVMGVWIVKTSNPKK